MTELELLEKLLEEQKQQTKLISHLGIIVTRATWMILVLIIAVIIF